MKSRTWAAILAALLLACIVGSLLLFRPQEAAQAQIWSDGVLIATLPLSVDTVMTVECKFGTNVVTVRGGKIAVTEADCPDGYCVSRGFCSGGGEIICLPHRLIIRFIGTQTLDGVSG